MGSSQIRVDRHFSSRLNSVALNYALNVKTADDDFWELVSGRKRGWRATLRRIGLRAASWAYALAIWIRNRLYDLGWLRVEYVSAPVISVGNLTVGGTGKTPCVEYIARYLSDRGYRVSILSRGYGSAGGASDEAMLLEGHLPDVPHLVGADRASLARAAMEELESDALILDDGFQHRRLARTFDLVLIDSTEPWGFGSQLPRGLLRESPGELRRASGIMISRCELASPDRLTAIRERIARLAPNTPVFESEHRPVCWINSDGRQLAVSDLQDGKMMAFCGIGNPNAFFQTVEMSGGNLIDRRVYPDHHRYSRADVEELERWAANAPDAIVVTTEKDLVKLRIANLGGRALWALRVGLIVRTGEEQLKQMLDRLLP